ncbi:MAG TPA: response regulator [Pirellulales bacterium]|nr:response regulator [Pirellulales bacterium]
MSHEELYDNRRILIVDDNCDIHADYRRVLGDGPASDPLAAAEAELFGDAEVAAPRRLDFELAHASQGEEGYELLRREMRARPFALAFVDMRMPPGWDGLETIKRMWEADPRLQVVLCTAYSDYSWSQICDALRPCDRLLILKKPFDAIEVRQLAASLVAKWNLGRAADRSQRELQQAVDQRTLQLRAAKEAADRASRSKSEFLANISHEIRTPLTAILGFTRLLMNGGDSPDERNEYLQIIRASAEHQLVLINDLLDISKVEAGQMQIHRVWCSARRIIDEVLQTLHYRADEKGLTLASDWPGATDDQAYTDPSRLRQLLINLVHNAIKFTASGSVRVVARVETLDGRRTLRIDVIDTGIGIDTAKQQAIFEPFVQADSSIAAQYGGTGLGLAISRSIAGLLGGTLTVTSRVGAGSTFTLTVDADPHTGESTPRLATEEANTSDVERELSLRGRRILVVEDNPFNRKLLRLTLSRAGAEVELAENGQVALDKARQHDFELVLMDVQMPLMDGYAATARFRQSGYRGPIVVLTAHALSAEREKCLAAGCDAFLSKPIDLDHLTEVVTQLLLSTPPPAGQRLPASGSGETETETDDSPEFQEVLRQYLESLHPTVVELRAALAAGNYGELASLGHTLKGTGGTIGFPTVSEIGERLERAVQQRLDGPIGDAIAQLADFIGRHQTA